MVKNTEMSVETVKIEKLIMTDENNQDIFMWRNYRDDIFVTNDESDEADASTFFFVISKEDWPEIKKFIDKQLL